MDADSDGVFAVRLPIDLGPFKAGQRLTINMGLAPVEHEYVLVRARGRRQFGTYGLNDEKQGTVTLWLGGVTREYRIDGTVIEVSQSTLRQPR